MIQGKNASFEIRDFELNKKNRKSRIREWSPSNKYKTNYKTSLKKCTI